MSYLDGLNEPQKQAVLHTDGPLLIVAGAGAGKTKTITHRIAHLIASGVPGRNILAVTFTNKAAEEMRQRVRNILSAGDLPAEASAQAGMRERVERLLGTRTLRTAERSPDLSQSERFRGGTPLVATFHSLGVRLLREFHERAGIPRGFSIWDRDDSVRAVKKALERIGIEAWKPAAILSAISREKGDGVSAAEYEARAKNYRERAVAQTWALYEGALAEEGALDFDDLLLRTLRLLQSSRETLSLLQNRWSHITIDEYQDTNKSQYEIARLLAGERNNMCAVGDVDQNIYSWRGADIAHLLSFERTFPGTKVILLEQNYRSTGTILAAANAVIEKNVRRPAKHLFTENPTGEPIALYGARTEMDEAWFVAMTASRLMEEGMPAGEIAVLYRENFQSRAIEEALLSMGLPYRVLGTKFFERKEVKDVLSYLRAAQNPRSRIDIARIAGVPPRGIGAATIEKMLAGNDGALSPAARKKVDAFRATIAAIASAIATIPASEAARFAVEASGMENMFRDGGEEGRERLENVRELVNLATRYDFETPPAGIERLLEEAALASDQDALDKESGGISLVTAHASKGLEFDAVFITGLEQGLFPSTRLPAQAGEDNHSTSPGAEKRDPEEERRLFYVALTRARKRLFLSFAAERMKYGSREHTVPSEFFEDIDERLLSYATPEAAAREDIIT